MLTRQKEIEYNNLLNRNYTTINAICLRYCGGNTFYFDELRQECAMEIWAEFSRYGLARLRDDSSESTWIYQISYHAIAHYLRNNKHIEFPSVGEKYDIENFASNENHDCQLLDELTTQLNKRERNMLNHYLNDDSYSTIARVEGISPSNARKQMSRLLNKMKMLVHK